MPYRLAKKRCGYKDIALAILNKTAPVKAAMAHGFDKGIFHFERSF